MMNTYGVPILGIDTHWTNTDDGPTGAHVDIYASTPDGERRVNVRLSSGGIEWHVSARGHMEAMGHMPTPKAPSGIGELALLEDSFNIVCAAFYGDYESLDGEVESWV